MNKNHIAYIAALLLFGSNGIVAGFISLASYEIVFWRTMIGSILLPLQVLGAALIIGGALVGELQHKPRNSSEAESS